MRMIEKLKQYDPSLTITQVIEKIENEQRKEVEKEEIDFHRIAGEFKNTYLKRIKDCPLFGKTLQIFYIESITNKQRTTDWTWVYYIKGNKISFSKRDINFREILGSTTSDSLSEEEELKEMEVITQKEYYKYLNVYEQIKSKLKSLIKDNYDIR